MNVKANPGVVFPPGSTIGIFGSGQLGKMAAIAAKQMGYTVHVFSPDSNTPAGQVADLEIQASYTDVAAVESFAKQVDVVTLEFENVPVEALEAANKHAPVCPGAKTLATTQNRGLEKQLLVEQGIPTCQFKVVRSLDELVLAAEQLMPAILKTTTDGYDGKGQYVIRNEADLSLAWKTLGTDEAILEELIKFNFEFSVIGGRNSHGEFQAYPPIRNEHENQILDVSFVPSGIESEVADAATKIVSQIMEQLGTIGVLCVEFFYRDGEILVNEIAPRPHNSGHLTIEANETSQFEQQVRAVCGLPLGSTQLKTPAAMSNLLGQLWDSGQPAWEQAIAQPNVKLHLYGKEVPKANRKMGHLTATAESSQQAVEQVIAARDSLPANRSQNQERVVKA